MPLGRGIYLSSVLAHDYILLLKNLSLLSSLSFSLFLSLFFFFFFFVFIVGDASGERDLPFFGFSPRPHPFLHLFSLFFLFSFFLSFSSLFLLFFVRMLLGRGIYLSSVEAHDYILFRFLSFSFSSLFFFLLFFSFSLFLFFFFSFFFFSLLSPIFVF